MATFCFLSREASSSLPSWSRRHTILKASEMLRDMEGARESCSEMLLSARTGAESDVRAAWIFSSPWLSVFENAAAQKRAARLTERIPTRSAPRPHTEPTPSKLVGMAMYLLSCSRALGSVGLSFERPSNGECGHPVQSWC